MSGEDGSSPWGDKTVRRSFEDLKTDLKSNAPTPTNGPWVPPPDLGATLRQAAPTRSGDTLVGMTVGEYQVLAPLGEGGMGMVYRGEQPLIGKAVAIKVLKPEFASDPSQVKRFLAEARAVNAARHPGIIDIFSFGQLPDGRQYMVMELLQGRSLDEQIAEHGKLTLDLLFSVLEHMCSALAAAHAAGVIHRDLKPSNVFLCDLPDGGHYVKVLDFGLAKSTVVQPGNRGAVMTATGMVVGTPAYMAPEQARGDTVTFKCDLYALGILIFELATGKTPFEANSAVELMLKQLNEKPPRLSSKVANLPEGLDDLVAALLAKEPVDRPESMAAVKREVQRLRREISRVQTVMVPVKRPSQRIEVPPPDDHVTDSHTATQTGPGRPKATGFVEAQEQTPVKKSPSTQILPPVHERASRGATTAPMVMPRSGTWKYVLVGALVFLNAAGFVILWNKTTVAQPPPLPPPVEVPSLPPPVDLQPLTPPVQLEPLVPEAVEPILAPPTPVYSAPTVKPSTAKLPRHPTEAEATARIDQAMRTADPQRQRLLAEIKKQLAADHNVLNAMNTLDELQR